MLSDGVIFIDVPDTLWSPEMVQHRSKSIINRAGSEEPRERRPNQMGISPEDKISSPKEGEEQQRRKYFINDRNPGRSAEGKNIAIYGPHE